MQYEVRYRAGHAIGSLTIQSDGGTCSVALTSICGITTPGYCSIDKTVNGNVESVDIASETVDVDDTAIVQLAAGFKVRVAVYETYVEVFEYEEGGG